MSRFCFCHSPLFTLRDGIVCCIYVSNTPRFLANIDKLGQGGAVSSLEYAGSNIVFSYGLDNDEVFHYLLFVQDNIDGAPTSMRCGEHERFAAHPHITDDTFRWALSIGYIPSVLYSMPLSQMLNMYPMARAMGLRGMTCVS